MTLTAKQERFVAEYLIDLNATQAAIRAGYSEKTAQQQRSRLLLNVLVQEAIAKGREKTAAKLEITKERIVDELAKIAFADIRKAVRWGKSPIDTSLDNAKAVRAEPISALYEQGKVHHVGIFPDLEDQMCNFTASGYVGEGSPDRADALVWARPDLDWCDCVGPVLHRQA
ncbi:phage terminase small subunit [Ochrobactrum sp. RH2CCR150]|nr:phage terminase small subunit [Ochrobactrum sp. RH2CCR150]